MLVSFEYLSKHNNKNLDRKPSYPERMFGNWEGD